MAEILTVKNKITTKLLTDKRFCPFSKKQKQFQGVSPVKAKHRKTKLLILY